MLQLNAVSADALGYVAASFVFLAFCMKTMLSLRLVAIASNIAFILYALVGDLTPILLLHGTLLPLNLLRLLQAQRRVLFAAKAAEAEPTRDDFDYLIAAGDRFELPAGKTLFVKGDAADDLFVVIEGQIFFPEIAVTLGPGSIFGEIGLFSRDRRRTASARAVGPVKLGKLTGQKVRELSLGDPRFANKIAGLIAQRLVDHLNKLENHAGACAAAIANVEPRDELRFQDAQSC